MSNYELIQETIKNLEKRNIKGYYFKDQNDCIEYLLNYMKQGSLVSFGGSTTINQINLIPTLEKLDYKLILRNPNDDIEKQKRLARESFFANYYLCSCNAISKDGILINIDGNSNRVACISYGPDEVLFIVGVNKIAQNLDEAIKRARNIAAVKNAKRFDISTPCKKTDTCHNCLRSDTICCQFLTTRYSKHTNRIHVLFIDSELGF